MIKWLAEKDPDKTCGYNNVVGETPFGRFLITWKGWKEWPTYTVDDAPIDVVGFCGSSLDEAKEHCDVEYAKLIDAATTSLRAELAVERERHTDLALAHGRIVQDSDAALTRLAQMEDALAKARGALHSSLNTKAS
jgi:hypothetical protein